MTTETAFKKGDRVKDAFKRPKPGDECVTGTVVLVEPGNVRVKWDKPDSVGRIERDIHPGLLEKLP